MPAASKIHTMDLFMTKICDFSHPTDDLKKRFFSKKKHTYFKTGLQKAYPIIAKIDTIVMTERLKSLSFGPPACMISCYYLT